nr:chromo domain-containing protein [Tanacetum cinerariifolium]
MSPYQALYGKVPLSIIPYPPGSSKVATVEDVLVQRDEFLRQLRDNLLAGKNRSGSEAVAEILRESDDCFMLEQPLAFCGSLFVLRDGSLIKQVLVQWTRRSHEDVTWEYLSDFQAAYPAYDLEDK